MLHPRTKRKSLYTYTNPNSCLMHKYIFIVDLGPRISHGQGCVLEPSTYGSACVSALQELGVVKFQRSKSVSREV